MAIPRVTSDLLLVGSLPVPDAETALRAGAELFGDLVAALPDGETGPRAMWVRYDRQTLRSPDVEPLPGRVAAELHGTVLSGTAARRVRPGATGVRWDRWPRIDEAIASYRVFRGLRTAGVIPRGVRFQVGLPGTYSVLSRMFPDPRDYELAAGGFTQLACRELDRLFAAVPASDLAVQWDLANEVLDLEGVFPPTRGDRDGAWRRFAAGVERLARHVPEAALMGYHLCYGTFPAWPMHEPRDMSTVVLAANYAAGNSGRRVDWLHLAGPPYLRSADPLFFRPLAGLAGGPRLFLGLALPADGAAGLALRARTAAPFAGDFGVAACCGFGRQPGTDGMATLREHAAVVREYLAGREGA